MKQRFRFWIPIVLTAFAILMFGVAGGLSASTPRVVAEEPDTLEAAALVGQSISYQGVLLDSAGNPITGNQWMRFALYDAALGGTQRHQTAWMNVPVNNGLFHVGLNVPQAVFDGKALWLQITVQSHVAEVLSPRQEIRPAPYAMSLRPGALVVNQATGPAVRVESPDVGLYGQGGSFAVYGVNDAGAMGAGYGGYFTSSTGIGVLGRSTASSTAQNPYTPGVHGSSQFGAGVLGTSDSVFGAGVFGNVATGTGVIGSSGGDGLVGTGQAHAVRGINTGAPQGSGYGGFFTSSTGIGVAGRSTATLSFTNQFAPGVYGYSQRGAAIMGDAQGATTGAVAGYFRGPVIVDGNLSVTGSKTGYVVDIARNAGADPLELGDLVVVVGVTDPVLGEIPVPLVERAQSEGSTAVIGVVAAAYHVDEALGGRMEMAEAGSGEYVTIVTLGSFSGIKVDARYGAIRPGDLLVSSPTAGHAMRADSPGIGTVIGKALGALDEGVGVIPIMVTLQ